MTENNEKGSKEKGLYRCRICGAPKRGHVCTVDTGTRGKGRFRPFEADLNHLIHRIEDLERDLVMADEVNASLRTRLSLYEKVDPPNSNPLATMKQLPIRPTNPTGGFVFVPYRGPSNTSKRKRSRSPDSGGSSNSEGKEVSTPRKLKKGDANASPGSANLTASHYEGGPPQDEHSQAYYPIPQPIALPYAPQYLYPQMTFFTQQYNNNPKSGSTDFAYVPEYEDPMDELHGSWPPSHDDRQGY